MEARRTNGWDDRDGTLKGGGVDHKTNRAQPQDMEDKIARQRAFMARLLELKLLRHRLKMMSAQVYGRTNLCLLVHLLCTLLDLLP